MSGYVCIYRYTYTDTFQGGVALNHQLVEQCVENLCQKGCRAVWADIDTLEAGQSLPEVEGLSSNEVAAVVSELKSVMAAYQDSCSTS